MTPGETRLLALLESAIPTGQIPRAAIMRKVAGMSDYGRALDALAAEGAIKVTRVGARIRLIDLTVSGVTMRAVWGELGARPKLSAPIKPAAPIGTAKPAPGRANQCAAWMMICQDPDYFTDSPAACRREPAFRGLPAPRHTSGGVASYGGGR